jgi:hypothetical protein
MAERDPSGRKHERDRFPFCRAIALEADISVPERAPDRAAHEAIPNGKLPFECRQHSLQRGFCFRQASRETVSQWAIRAAICKNRCLRRMHDEELAGFFDTAECDSTLRLHEGRGKPGLGS